MSDELRTMNDGFDDDGMTDSEIRVIQGEKWKFNNEGDWVNDSDEVIPPTREVVVVDVTRVLQKWIDRMPVKGTTRFISFGERIDTDALNEACPKSEWGEDPGGHEQGPWRIQAVVYMVDATTMARFTYTTNTAGGGIAIGDLRDAVKWMRKLKGPGIYPVVSLGDKHMNTRFGGRQRPHFVIKRWISFGPDGMTPLPAPASPQGGPGGTLPLASSQGKLPKASSALPSGTRSVEEPTLHEEMDDGIPF
jgi:hypothetical protein